MRATLIIPRLVSAKAELPVSFMHLLAAEVHTENHTFGLIDKDESCIIIREVSYLHCFIFFANSKCSLKCPEIRQRLVSVCYLVR